MPCASVQADQHAELSKLALALVNAVRTKYE